MTGMDDKIRDDLARHASGIDPGDASGDLDAVRTTARRRTGRRRVAIALAAVLVVAGGAVAATSLRDSRPDTVRTSDENTPPPGTDQPATTGPSPVTDPPGTDPSVTDPSGTGPSGTDPSVTDPSVTDPGATDTTAAARVEREVGAAIEGTRIPASPSAVPAPGGAGVSPEWLVPWRDGFLTGVLYQPPQASPEKLTEETKALFPPEINDLFPDGMPPTLNEAAAVLSEAGLLDEAMKVLEENQTARDEVYAVPPGTPELRAWFSTDGEQWEPVGIVAPAGLSWLQHVTTVGDRLVVAGPVVAPDTAGGQPTSTVVVASTTDLVDWSVQSIEPAIDPALRELADADSSIDGFAANGSGWVASVSTYPQLDLLSLLPDAIRPDDVQGWFTDDTGVQVDVANDDGTTASRSYSWEELGIDEPVRDFLQRGVSSTWHGSWDGAPGEVTMGSDRRTGYQPFPQLAATDAGFLAVSDVVRFSPDGLAWSSSPAPADAVTAVMALADGLIVFTEGADGTTLYRTDATGGDWREIVLPGAPHRLSPTYGGVTAPVTVIDAFDPPPSDGPEIVVELDGYRWTTQQTSGGSRYELVDLSTGDVVSSESVGPEVDWADAGPFEYARIEASGTVLLDPDSGDELLVVPHSVSAQAAEEAWNATGAEPIYTPDLWVLATTDGVRWLIDDLVDQGDEYAGPMSVAAVNGDVVLVRGTTGWLRYDLG